MEPRKRRAASSHIACDHCRKLKVKCDGVLPCARCSKNSLLCIFSPGKKKHSVLHLQKTSEGKQLEPLFTLNPKENVLMTSQIINSCVNLRTLKLSQFFIQPESRIREIFPWDSLQGKLQLYSILSLHFRANGDIDVADKFLNHSLSLSKEVFDDCQTETTIHSAFGLSSLASALSTKDMKKAQHFINLSTSLLEDCEFSNQEYNYLKFFILKLNTVLFSQQFSPNLSLIQNFALNSMNLNDLIAARNPKFRFEEYDNLDPRLIVKIGLVEVFAIMREVIFHFDPSMSEISWTINEEYLKANLKAPKEVAELCLQIVEKMEQFLIQNFSGDPFFQKSNPNYFKGIFNRWVGNHEKEIEAWKETINFVNENFCMAPTPFIRIAVLIFYPTYYLLDSGIIEDPAVEKSFSFLHRFATTYSVASEVLEYLTKFKETVSLRFQESSELKPQQESCVQRSLSTQSLTLTNSSQVMDLYSSMNLNSFLTPTTNLQYLPSTSQTLDSSFSQFLDFAPPETKIQDPNFFEFLQGEFSDPNSSPQSFDFTVPTWNGGALDENYSPELENQY